MRAKDIVIDELAVLVRRLAYSLKKAKPDNDLSEKAVDYLNRNNLTGSPLRKAQLERTPMSDKDDELVNKAFDYAVNTHGFARLPGNYEAIKGITALIRQSVLEEGISRLEKETDIAQDDVDFGINMGIERCILVLKDFRGE